MLTALWHFSAAIRGYLRFYMPTNRAIDWLRTPRGLKWAIPVALAATPAYLGLTALTIQGAARPGLGWLNVLVFLFYWNAMKFAWMAVLSVPTMLAHSVRGHSSQVTVGADSGGGRNTGYLVVGEQLSEDLGGGVEAESFAGAVVELLGDGLQVVVGVD